MLSSMLNRYLVSKILSKDGYSFFFANYSLEGIVQSLFTTFTVKNSFDSKILPQCQGKGAFTIL